MNNAAVINQTPLDNAPINRKAIKKTVNPAHLNSEVVLSNNLKGWRAFLWDFWGNRSYEHNSDASEEFAGYMLILLITAGATALLVGFSGFKYLTLLFFCSTTGLILLWPIGYANKSPYSVWGNFIIGAVGRLSPRRLAILACALWRFFLVFLIGLIALARSRNR